MVVVIDFGSQTANLIERRIRELHIPAKFVTPEDALSVIEKEKPHGIIFSGGPSSVYDPGSPDIDPKIFTLGIPILAICYGFQLLAKHLGGDVVSGRKEYGPSILEIGNLPASPRGEKLDITRGFPRRSTVWMSHGDEIKALPKGFSRLGATEGSPFAFAQDAKRKIIGVLFHPEVEHTEYGISLLKNFITLCEVPAVEQSIDIDKLIADIKKTVGKAVVIGAVSGGVDSTVAAALTAKAIGSQFTPIYVENGLMRPDTKDHVRKIFKQLNVPVDIVECEDEMLERLKGVEDPEEKRKVIGAFYIEIFEREMEKLLEAGKDIQYLMQGTIYSDVIESKGTKHADKIKSHHNVGGLPEHMKLKLLEPLRTFYKDEVRVLGKKLGLSDEFIWRQVFPGPGYGVRVRGKVTKERLEKVKQADAIILEELEKANLLANTYMSFAIMSGASSTAVKGDGRFFGEVVAVRVVESRDVMTAKWSHLPYDVLQSIATRIVNEVPKVSRVVYDITTKPPATMEWE
ncbi:MAG TPA: glutamine-hydrolyzing GMP synthase [Patescibacteria group bacterium]|nr:glutamine-hydrolyzing GMP synthase [Patescibacteria group bacterium]